MTPRILAAVLVLVTAAPAWAQEFSAVPDAALKATHGDWQLLCFSDEAGAEECFIAQAVDEEASGQRVMTAMIMKAPDGAPALRVTVPLGVLIPRGVNVSVDGADLGNIGFVTCFDEGCMTQVAMALEVVAAMKAGGQATITVFDTQDQPIGLPLSLSGFTAAFDAF